MCSHKDSKKPLKASELPDKRFLRGNYATIDTAAKTIVLDGGGYDKKYQLSEGGYFVALGIFMRNVNTSPANFRPALHDAKRLNENPEDVVFEEHRLLTHFKDTHVGLWATDQPEKFDAYPELKALLTEIADPIPKSEDETPNADNVADYRDKRFIERSDDEEEEEEEEEDEDEDEDDD